VTAPLEISLAGRDFLRISDLVPAEAEAILDRAVELRASPKQPLLPGATLGLFFAKHSTRTRVSFTAGMAQLGGAAVHLAPEELQLSRGESLPDTARALSGYLDALAVRVHSHAELEEWAHWASIPVINALTAEEHPCQALADALTMRDRLGSLDGVRVAWVGDGSNVCTSLARLGLLLGYEVIAACPEGYEPAVDVHLVRDPREAVRAADVISGCATSRATASMPLCSGTRPRTRSSCTACRRTRARRSLPTCSTGNGRRSGTRPRTACTSRKRCLRSCSALREDS
jgi:ornithine carbamoyltransferase